MMTIPEAIERKMTPKEKLDSAVSEIEAIAYKKGLREGWVELQCLAVIIPSSVTKKDLIHFIELAAKKLQIKLESEQV